ncbi:MAG: acyl-CoA dehydrogenase family protein, partial [Deltaproteobacteria bacterium]|nr:acyl-CoA dehydrogenase family protein [Deltaproteobacteria bacterium]MDZ4343504.1 acyl-CoA dehydrogenase family protein [Candidatus Binatia bacterium]
MDFRLTEEEKLIRDTAAQFVQRELVAREGDFLRQEELFLPPGAPPRRELDPKITATLTKIARRVGLWALELPASDGAEPLSMVTRMLIHREFGRTVLPFAPACIPGVIKASKHAQDLADGKLSLVLAFDQMHKTGTFDGITTYYRETADGYVLSVASIDIIDPDADLFLFPAREEGSSRAGLFLLDRDTPGMTIGAVTELTTDVTVGKLTLQRCKLQAERLVGYEYQVQEIVASEQLRIAARCLGIAIRCLADSIEHARNRVTFGRRLAERQAIQWMLADLSVGLRTCTWLTLEAAWRADHELPYFEEAALAKKRAAKMAFEATDTAIQIHGGYGVCKEFPFEGFYREARLLRLLYGRESEMDRAAGEKFIRVK